MKNIFLEPVIAGHKHIYFLSSASVINRLQTQFEASINFDTLIIFLNSFGYHEPFESLFFHVSLDSLFIIIYVQKSLSQT